MKSDRSHSPCLQTEIEVNARLSLLSLLSLTTLVLMVGLLLSEPWLPAAFKNEVLYYCENTSTLHGKQLRNWDTYFPYGRQY